MHGKCILAPKAPVFLQCDTQFLLLDFIGVICGFRCYSVHELSTDWLNKGILMNEPKLASIFRLMRLSECIAAIPPQKPKKKKSASRQIQSCWAPKKLSNIRNTYLHFFFFYCFPRIKSDFSNFNWKRFYYYYFLLIISPFIQRWLLVTLRRCWDWGYTISNCCISFEA